MTNLGKLVATATLDVAPFLTNTKQLKTYLKSLDSSLKTVENSFKGQKSNLSSLKTTYAQTGQSLTAYQAVLKKQSEHYNQLKAEIGDVNNASSQERATLINAQAAMTATAAKVADLQNKYNSLGKEIAIQSSSFTQIGNKLVESGNTISTTGDKINKFGSSVSGVGKALTTGLTTPIVTGVGAVVKSAISWESAFAGVKKTNDEVIGSNGQVTYSYADLENGLRNLATTLPSSHQEIAAVAEAAGQLGIETPNVVSFTKTMIDMGESTNMSAETAASSLAKYANITNMSQTQFSNLGSAIVDLGNNFATTESDITAMALRLAGAGAQIGLSQGDILGLSTALSSVGIEAEMGGSAFSKVMVNMQVAAATGIDGMEDLTAKTGLTRRELELMSSNSSKDFKALADSIGMTTDEMENIMQASSNLENFANIAGMTSEEFKQAFETDAVGAIGKFVDGLGHAEERGTTAIEMLDQMGISEVRLRDALLRAGNASDLFKSAVDRGNQAFEQNTALTNEANKRYETTESKLKALKNKVVDTAITFGGPFVDALSDALEAGEPLIENLSSLAKAFTSLSKEQQQQIIKWGLIAAAAGPAISIAGKGISVFGSITSAVGTATTALGNGFKKIGELTGGLKLLGSSAGEIETVATSATTAEGAVGGLTGAVGLLGNPVTWGVLLGGAALLTIGYFADKAADAKQRTEEWGTAVSQAQANELQQFKDKVDETNQAMSAFGTEGAADVEAVRKAFQDLADEINGLADKDLNKKIKLAEKMGLSEEQIQRLKDAAQETKDNVNAMSEDVIKIYQNAADNHREITETERSIVKSAQNAMIEEKLSLLGYEKDESVAIRKAMNGEIDELNTEQASKGLKTVKKWIEEENSNYEENKNNYKKLFEAKALTQEEYNQKIEELEANHKAVMEGYSEQYIALQKKVAESALKNSSPEAQKAILTQIQNTMDELGVSYEEFQAKMEETADKASKASTLVGTYWQGMSDEARTAVDYWNSIVLDTKTGEVKTNAQEEIRNALNAEGGWESMKLSVKEGKLTTTATMAIGEALIATSQWDNLSPDDKQLVVDHSPAMKAITESESNLQAWKEIPDPVKELLANNTDFLNNTDVAKTLLENWNSLEPEEKQLVAKNMTSDDVELAQRQIDQLSGKTVELDADDNTSQPTLDAYIKVNGVAQKAPASIKAQDDTAPDTASAQANINDVNQMAPASVKAQDDTASGTSSAQNKIDNTQQKKPASVKAQNDTGDGTSRAQSAIDRTQQRSPIAIRAADYATSTVTGIVSGFPTTHTIKVVAQAAGDLIGKIFGHEKGTNFHPGGLAMVNDQKGPTYRELVTLPDGTSFIPQGRNVMLPLPRGSKVLPAGKTKQLFPQYANGIGFENTRVADVARRIGNLQAVSDVVVAQNDNSDINRAINKLIELVMENTDSLDKLAEKQFILENYMDSELVGRSVAKAVTNEQNRSQSIRNAINGLGW